MCYPEKIMKNDQVCIRIEGETIKKLKDMARRISVDIDLDFSYTDVIRFSIFSLLSDRKYDDDKLMFKVWKENKTKKK